MIESIPENREVASREEVLSALEEFAENLDVNHLKRVKEEEVSATEAEICAATAILRCVELVNQHGLVLLKAIKRIYLYSQVPDPVDIVYEIANSDPERPIFPAQKEDIYGCKAILCAMKLAGATL